ncbi:3-methyl-2-oxobutanoate hydroxymethyltransferase, partial [Magnaporthiopsis poae ATCC 64411]
MVVQFSSPLLFFSQTDRIRTAAVKIQPFQSLRLLAYLIIGYTSSTLYLAASHNLLRNPRTVNMQPSIVTSLARSRAPVAVRSGYTTALRRTSQPLSSARRPLTLTPCPWPQHHSQQPLDQRRYSSHSPMGVPPPTQRKKVTLGTLRAMHRRGEPITFVTA